MPWFNTTRRHQKTSLHHVTTTWDFSKLWAKSPHGKDTMRHCNTKCFDTARSLQDILAPWDYIMMTPPEVLATQDHNRITPWDNMFTLQYQTTRSLRRCETTLWDNTTKQCLCYSPNWFLAISNNYVIIKFKYFIFHQWVI